MHTDHDDGVLKGSFVPNGSVSDGRGTSITGIGPPSRLGLVIHTDSPDPSKQVFVSEDSSKQPQSSPTESDSPSIFGSFEFLPDDKTKSQSELDLSREKTVVLQSQLEATQEENKKLNETLTSSQRESEQLRAQAAALQLELQITLKKNQQLDEALQLSQNESKQLQELVASQSNVSAEEEDEEDEDEDEGDDKFPTPEHLASQFTTHQPISENKNDVGISTSPHASVKDDMHETQFQHFVSDENSDEENFLDFGYVPILIPFGDDVLTKQNFKSLFKEHVKGEQQQSEDSKISNQVLYEFVQETQDQAKAALGAYLKRKSVSFSNKYIIIAEYKRKEKDESVSSDPIYFTCGGVDYEVSDNWVQVAFDFHGKFQRVSTPAQPPEYTDAVSRTYSARQPYLVSVASQNNRKRDSLSSNPICTVVTNDQLDKIVIVKNELKKEIHDWETSCLYGKNSYLYTFFPSALPSLKKKIDRKKIKLAFVREVVNEIKKSNDNIGDIVNKLAAKYRDNSKWDDVRAGISSDTLGYSNSKTFNLLKSLGYNEESVDQLVNKKLQTG